MMSACFSMQISRLFDKIMFDIRRLRSEVAVLPTKAP